MGLDTTHDCWHGPYSSFMEWRIEIAKQIGIPNLREMKGFGGNIEWNEYLHHPLYTLLFHSDCDGEMSPAEAKTTALGLSQIVNKISDEWMKKKTEQFIKGCELAFSKNEIIQFH